MADDDVREQLRLSQALVMTPQLQMAIRLLSMSAAEVRALVAEHLAKYPGSLVEGDPPPPDPADEDADHWLPRDDDPFGPVGAGLRTPDGDVVVHGDPPIAQANGAAFPRVIAHDTRPLGSKIPPRDHPGFTEAAWLARSLRQRAKSYERIVAALVALRPAIATATARTAADVAPAPLRAIAEHAGMHESTIARVARSCTLRNQHGLFALAVDARDVGLRSAG